MTKLATILVFFSLVLGSLDIPVAASFRSQISPARRIFKEPDDELDQFIGKVKSITVETETHEFTTHFMDFGNRYKRVPLRTTQFDRAGKKVESVHYRIDGVALPKTTYSYDSNGVLLKGTFYSALSGEPYVETVYGYDSQGALTEVIERNIKDNKVFSRKLYSQDLNYLDLVEYDSDNVVRGKVRFSLNNQDKVREVVSFSPQGKILGKEIISYDENGNRAGMVLLPSDGSPKTREKYTYNLDGRGNWVKKTLYHWTTRKGKSLYELISITYRTIVYY